MRGRFVAAYALSSIDLMPDFIPVIGYLDDLIVVPLGLMFVIRLMPPDGRVLRRSCPEGRAPGEQTGNVWNRPCMVDMCSFCCVVVCAIALTGFGNAASPLEFRTEMNIT